MSGALDVLTARNYIDRAGETKTAWTKLGRAFPNRQGEGYTVILDALPLHNEKGECKLLLREPRDSQQMTGRRQPDPDPFNGQGAVPSDASGRGEW